MPQFKAFVRSAERVKREQMASLIQAASFAMADGKDTNKAVSKLLDGNS